MGQITQPQNIRSGFATLVAGAVTVADESVTADSRILLTSQVDGGTPGFLRVTGRVPGVSFDVQSSDVLDTSTIAYMLQD